MSFLRSLPRAPVAHACLRARRYAAKVASPITNTTVPPGASKAQPVDPESESRSSCSPNTLLVGLNYLKDQPPVVALPDDEYPPWLWTLLQPKVLPDDGPGGMAEKVRLRKENRQRIKDQNFMKTQ